jgi:replicative DNA helicase
MPSIAGYYSEKLKEDLIARELITVQTVISRGLAEEKKPQDIRADVEKALAAVTVSNGSTHAKDIVHGAMRMLDRGKGLPFALVGIDRIFNGFLPGDLVVLAARPGMGKSALAGNLSEYHGRKQRKVLIFSLEMTKEQWVCRLVCSIANVEYANLLNKKATPEEMKRVVAAMEEVSKLDIIIDDTPAINIADLRAIVRREKPALVIVDYLQLVSCDEENRFQEVSAVSRQLKACAKESSTSVLALSQMNRAVEQRTDKRPTISDLRESGQIEQDADCIMFIYRESQYCEACKLGNCNDPHKTLAEVEVAKQRNGRTGLAFLRWFGGNMRFEDRDDFR